MPRRPSRLRLVALGVDAGAPLLRFVTVRGGVPEEVARAAILRGGAFLRGQRVRDLEEVVREGDRVEVDLRESPPTELPRILHLDRLVLAVDKPGGVLAQEGRGGGPALPELCAQLLRARGEPDAALLVHRLDRGTTGVTVLARTKAAQAALLREFREGRVAKEYLALCAGDPPADEMESDLALAADPAVPGKRRADPRGEPARSRFRVVRRLRSAALIAAFPETGRTHQVRVHLAALGLPLAGDARYGGPRSLGRPDGRRLEVSRPLLHALALRLRHPEGHELSLRAPVPADLKAAIEFLAP
ncbi:MAG: RluA family pseudouridine synthase [Myxococcales bacterium]